jgi:hypothetical protein
VRKEISANGMRRNREDQGMSLYTRKFQPKGQNEEKMTWTTLLSLVAAKSGGPFGQNSHSQSFSFF